MKRGSLLNYLFLDYNFASHVQTSSYRRYSTNPVTKMLIFQSSVQLSVNFNRPLMKMVILRTHTRTKSNSFSGAERGAICWSV
jgi:hypothetical protein